MANQFQVAEQFVEYLRLHDSRGRVAINQRLLARDFNCSPGTLGTWIGRMTEAGIVNRSPHRVPDGVEHWFTENARDAMMRFNWRDTLHSMLHKYAVKNPQLNVGQRFSIVDEYLRELERGIAQQLAAKDKTIGELRERIKELEETDSSMRFEMNRMMVRMQELEMTLNKTTVVLNIHEKRIAAESSAAAKATE